MSRKPQPARGCWGERWLAYLQQVFGVKPTAAQVRGARQGLATLHMGRGRVAADVPYGSYGAVARAVLRVKPLNARDWRRVLDTVAADADAARRLLSGNLGPELEACFADTGLALFPEPTGPYHLRCGCGQRWGCRHINVLAVRWAEQFDGNPFLWLEVLGKPRDQIFAYLRPLLARAGQTGAGAEQAMADGAGAAEPIAPERYWAGEGDPDAIPIHPAGAAPDALLRALGVIDLPGEVGWVEMLTDDVRVQGPIRYAPERSRLEPVSAVLPRYVVHVAQAARALAAGDRAPAQPAVDLPGKPIPTGTRLAAEVEEAVRQAGGLLELDDLRRLCPTAAAVAAPYHRRLLAAACQDLSEDLAVLGGRWVGPRSAPLEGAAFHHIITFGEWQHQALSAGADWVRILGAAGCTPPFKVRLAGREHRILAPASQGATAAMAGPDPVFVLLRPEVGDALWLSVRDGQEPLVEARLIRRAERTGAGVEEATLAAAAALLSHMEYLGTERISASEAIQVLLAIRQYREGHNPVPVWLLPLWTPGLAYDEQSLRYDGCPGLCREGCRWAVQWRPAFGRSPYAYWREQDKELPWLGTLFANQGATLKQVDRALTLVRAWCRYWRGPQDGSGPIPTPEAFLDFLWNVAPLEARARQMTPESVLASLKAWFSLLAQRHPKVQGLYDTHLAACELTAAYAHRQRSLPPHRNHATAELAAWHIEGYRWIGPEAWFADTSLTAPAG